MLPYIFIGNKKLLVYNFLKHEAFYQFVLPLTMTNCYFTLKVGHRLVTYFHAAVAVQCVSLSRQHLQTSIFRQAINRFVFCYKRSSRNIKLKTRWCIRVTGLCVQVKILY